MFTSGDCIGCVTRFTSAEFRGPQPCSVRTEEWREPCLPTSCLFPDHQHPLYCFVSLTVVQFRHRGFFYFWNLGRWKVSLLMQYEYTHFEPVHASLFYYFRCFCRFAVLLFPRPGVQVQLRSGRWAAGRIWNSRNGQARPIAGEQRTKQQKQLSIRSLVGTPVIELGKVQASHTQSHVWRRQCIAHVMSSNARIYLACVACGKVR